MPGPIVWKDSTTDLIKDGAGDATIGTCGTQRNGRDGSDGFDSHTYVKSDRKGLFFDGTLVGTEEGDSLPRPVVFNESGICNQFFGSRLYPTVAIQNQRRDLALQVRRALFPFLTDSNLSPEATLSGQFHLPSAPILANAYTKSFQVRIGADRAGGNWEQPGKLNFQGGAFIASQYQILAHLTFTFASPKVDLVYLSSDGDLPLNSRKVILRIYPGSSANYEDYDTDVTLGELIDSGITFQIEINQTSIQQSGSSTLGLYDVGVDVTYSIPNSQFELPISRIATYKRCQTGFAYCRIYTNRKRGFVRVPDDYDGPFQSQSQFVGQNYRVTTGDPAWWVNHINSFTNSDLLYLFSWINDFIIADGEFTDDAAFRVASFLHRSSAGVIKTAKYAADFESLTIPNGTTIDVGEVAAGDTFHLGLDNLGEVTTNVSSIAFDNPFITSVSDSSPMLSPYEFQSIDFDAEPLSSDGSADITSTHDKNNLIIPSPYSLTLSGVAPGGGPGVGGGGPG